MNVFIRMIMYYSPVLQELSYMLIRVGLGALFFKFGLGKLLSGPTHMAQLGSVMAMFGIVSGYALWGYIAACTEFFGGLSYVFGFCSRLASLPLLLLLFIVIQFHLNKGDSFTTWSFPLILFIITIGFLVGGSGKYSCDYFLTHKEIKNRYDV